MCNFKTRVTFVSNILQEGKEGEMEGWKEREKGKGKERRKGKKGRKSEKKEGREGWVDA